MYKSVRITFEFLIFNYNLQDYQQVILDHQLQKTALLEQFL